MIRVGFNAKTGGGAEFSRCGRVGALYPLASRRPLLVIPGERICIMTRLNRSLLWLCLIAGSLLTKSPVLAQDISRFTLEAGERVALIGDALIDDDAAQGFLEYFFATQSPGKSIDTRNLAWVLAAPGTNEPAKYRVTTNSLAALRKQLDAFRPTIAVVGFGLASGPSEVTDVTNAIERVLATLRQSAGTNPVRLIILSPLRREQAAPPLDLAVINLQLSNTVSAVEALATRRGGRFVNLFERLTNDRMIPPPPSLTGEGGHLTGYGCRRMAEWVAYLIGFEPPRWRFGVLADGKMRQGGYGVTVLETNKTTERARFVVQLANLPLPPLPANLTNAYDMNPANRMQIVGMKPGRFDFKIDGQTVATPTDQALNQSIVVGSGPMYDRAEQLRQAIVKKAELHRQRARNAGPLKPEEAARLDKQLAELEKRIADLRVPGKNVLEIVPAAPQAP